MKTRPILFSAPMVRAILDGSKTQTRRVVKPQPPDNHEPPYQRSDGEWVTTLNEPPHTLLDFKMRCPYGQPVDRLWVRETFYVDTMPDGRLPGGPVILDDWGGAPLDMRDVYYRADGECCDQIPECSCAEVGRPNWRPSIFMPRWASRLTLDVLEVRVERVQDISEEDARAEGVTLESVNGTLNGEPAKIQPFTHRSSFGFLWNTLNAKRGYSWESNPFVWVVVFQRVLT